MEKVANKLFSGAGSNSSQQSYSAPADEFSPSRFQAGLLKDNLHVHEDGTLPPWIVKGSQLPATEQFVQWFNSIWHTSDPNNYDEDVFAKNAVLIEPMGISRGAEQASENFWLLFRHFPNLCGEVVSWAANERSIFINWRLTVPSTNHKQPSSVPVTDQFCFMKGRVSFRLATFDILAMASYLSQSYGMGQLLRFIIKHLRHSKQTGGRSFLPGMLWNLITGIFHRPKVIKTDLKAIPGDGVVRLSWGPIEGAEAYTIRRATVLRGDYITLPPAGEFDPCHPHYEDTNVSNGMTYWYMVTPNFRACRLTPNRGGDLKKSCDSITAPNLIRVPVGR